MNGITGRSHTVEAVFLAWLHQRAEVHPRSGPFLTDPASAVDGEQVTGDELTTALDQLEARGLITSEGGFGGRFSHVDMTAAGRLCLADHGGDVRAWQAAKVGSSVQFTVGGNMQAAVNSMNTTQVMQLVQSGAGPVDRKKYERAASTLLAELDDLTLPEKQAEECRQAAEEIIAETAQPEPDDGKLRRWGLVIVKALGGITTAAAGGTAARYIAELLGMGS